MEEEHMRRRALAVLAVLAMAGGAGAQQQGNNPVSPVAVSDVSATVTFSGTVQFVHFTNDGAKDAIIRVFVTCETIAGIVTTDTKARLIKPGEGWGLTFTRGDVPKSFGSCTRDIDSGFGFVGFAHVAKAGETASLRWFAMGAGLP